MHIHTHNYINIILKYILQYKYIKYVLILYIYIYILEKYNKYIDYYILNISDVKYVNHKNILNHKYTKYI